MERKMQQTHVPLHATIKYAKPFLKLAQNSTLDFPRDFVAQI
jgi:hypothetical protein